MLHGPHPSISPLTALASVAVPVIEHRRRGRAIRCQSCDVTYLSWDPPPVEVAPGPWTCERCIQEAKPATVADSTEVQS